MFTSTLELQANLDAVLIRKDGSHLDIPNLSSSKLDGNVAFRKLRKAVGFWKYLLHDDAGLVTNAAVNFIAADMISGGSAHISSMNYADCGTGTTAENVSQTALVTPFGGSRVAGTQSNPTANQYRSVALIPFVSTLAVTEYGLFSASSAGTLFDRRVFSAINVNSGDSVSFQYTVTLVSGGS